MIGSPAREAGALDVRVQIQHKVVVREPTYGGETVAWTALATVWAQVIESATDGEAERTAQAAYARPSRVRMRWRADVDPTMRLLLPTGRLLQITGTAMVGRKQWLDLACQEWAHE